MNTCMYPDINTYNHNKIMIVVPICGIMPVCTLQPNLIQTESKQSTKKSKSKRTTKRTTKQNKSKRTIKLTKQNLKRRNMLFISTFDKHKRVQEWIKTIN